MRLAFLFSTLAALIFFPITFLFLAGAHLLGRGTGKAESIPGKSPVLPHHPV